MPNLASQLNITSTQNKTVADANVPKDLNKQETVMKLTRKDSGYGKTTALCWNYFEVRILKDKNGKFSF